MSLLDSLWVEKYRPKTLEDYIFQNPSHRAIFEEMIAKKSIPHLLLSGTQGTGKTSLAQILINAMELDETDVLTINASSKRGIDTFRDDITNFAMSMSMGAFKIVHLEEADKMTPDAQDALRSFMEEVSDTVRFVMTCNHVNKIIPPLRSRLQEFSFRAADILDITERLVVILSSEGVRASMKDVDSYVKIGYPDVRKVIGLVQQNTLNGRLQPSANSEGSSGYQDRLLTLINDDEWYGARKVVCDNLTADDWESMFTFLYKNINQSPKFKNRDKYEEAIIVIAEHLYKHTFVADPEINVAAMFIRLGQI